MLHAQLLSTMQCMARNLSIALVALKSVLICDVKAEIQVPRATTISRETYRGSDWLWQRAYYRRTAHRVSESGR